MSNLQKRLVSWELIFACLPDFICLYRIVATIVVVLLGIHPAAPWLFSTALISDLFDGWFWRHYSQHCDWFARRPYMPYDLVADFVLLASGTIYAMRHWWRFELRKTVVMLAILGIATAVLQIVPRVGPPSKLAFTVCATLATHITCCLMLATTVIVWRVNSSSWYGPIGTLAVFYAVFGMVGDKSRLIRRPPPGWRGLP